MNVPVRRSSKRNFGVGPNRLGYNENFEQVNSIVEPKNYQEVLTDVNKEKWIDAMKSEIDSMMKNETGILCELPDPEAVGCKWIFNEKTDQNGAVDRFKARLVPQGYSQKSLITRKYLLLL